MTESKPHIEQDVTDLRAWIATMRERDDWPETDLALMDAIERLVEQLETLDAWASRMPDAGFTSDDPRWDWWHERPRLSNPASEPEVANDH